MAHANSSASEEPETKPLRKRRRKDCDEDEVIAKQKEDSRKREAEQETADEADAEDSNSSQSDSESDVPLSKLVASKHKSEYPSPYPEVPAWTQVPKGGVREHWGSAILPIRGSVLGSPTASSPSYQASTAHSRATGKSQRSFHQVPGLHGMRDQSRDYKFAHPSTALNAFGRPFAPGAWGVSMSLPPNSDK